ncbi:MAG TPA: hypothetical protein VIK12_04770, partial [Pengzhenrongella sp.]
AWGYEVATRVSYRQAWIWTGTALVVVIGYLSLTARSVFEGAPARVQTVVGNVCATLLVLAGVICLALFAAVSHGANRSMAQPLQRAATEPSAWAPRSDEASFIADADAVVWEPGVVIDAGSLPSRESSVDDEPQAARYAYSSLSEPDEPDEPDDSPMTSAPARALAPDAPAAPPSTAMYRPEAPPAVAASDWTPTSSADEEAWEPVTPRRALPSADDVRP